MIKRGVDVKGFDTAFAGDVPLGAGMSSSAALESTYLQRRIRLEKHPDVGLCLCRCLDFLIADVVDTGSDILNPVSYTHLTSMPIL